MIVRPEAESFSETQLMSFSSLISFSSDVLRNILDMDPERIQNDDDFVEWVSGNKVLDGSTPMAHRYGGYQFGSWVMSTIYARCFQTTLIQMIFRLTN